MSRTLELHIPSVAEMQSLTKEDSLGRKDLPPHPIRPVAEHTRGEPCALLRATESRQSSLVPQRFARPQPRTYTETNTAPYRTVCIRLSDNITTSTLHCSHLSVAILLLAQSEQCAYLPHDICFATPRFGWPQCRCWNRPFRKVVNRCYRGVFGTFRGVRACDKQFSQE